MLGLHRHGVDILSIESSLRRARIVFSHMDKDAMEPHAKIYRRSRSSPPRTPWWRGSKYQASAAQDEGVPARLLGMSSMEYSIEKLSESLHEELPTFCTLLEPGWLPRRLLWQRLRTACPSLQARSWRISEENLRKHWRRSEREMQGRSGACARLRTEAKPTCSKQ
mmetsp:Transcript_9448/g.22577  ORF Transcript_9448/g.22577 Transcript_9448/m.22577 type:complete len:166 (-) Transcript_9448:308-805(-)